MDKKHNDTDTISYSGSGAIWGSFPYDTPCPADPTKRIVVNKQTHRVRYENETEHEVTIVIEPK